jgi:hypothetical protein
MQLMPFATDRPIAGGFTSEPRAIVDADRRYFLQNPQTKSYLRPMRNGEFGSHAPALSANVPTNARFFVLIEVQARTTSGWPKCLYRRPILVISTEAHAQSSETLHDRTRDARPDALSFQTDARQTRQNQQARRDAQGTDEERGDREFYQGGDPPPLKRKRHGHGRPRGVPNGIERTTDKLKRPLKFAIADLRELVETYGVDVRIRPDVIELTIDSTSAAASSAWARSAAERLALEYRQCPALRVRIARWATAQQQQQQGDT